MNRTPPNDIEAERSAIHACISTGRIPEPLRDVKPEHFYQPAHAAIWQVILWLVANGRACDGNAVLARLMETRQHKLVELYLPGLVHGPMTGDPANLALIILDRAGRRHLLDAAAGIAQRAYESEDPYEEILRQAEAELAKVPAVDSGNVDTLLTLSEFLGESVPEPKWVIPRLMARGERLILTGVEGFGKSTLMRQLAICAAAGMGPFTGRTCDPQTVLVIDVENPQWIMQQRYSELRRAVHAHGKFIEQGRLWIDRRPEGINVADPADRRWLQRRVNLVNPDLLVIGPAYKLHEAGNDDKDETIARTVTAVLDDLRGDAALVLEHHAGNEQGAGQRPVRPFGSSVWRRWPEFGYGLRPAKPPQGMDLAVAEQRRLAELVPWRGARDVRSWPKRLESGGDDLPWTDRIQERTS